MQRGRPKYVLGQSFRMDHTIDGRGKPKREMKRHRRKETRRALATFSFD